LVWSEPYSTVQVRRATYSRERHLTSPPSPTGQSLPPSPSLLFLVTVHISIFVRWTQSRAFRVDPTPRASERPLLYLGLCHSPRGSSSNPHTPAHPRWEPDPALWSLRRRTRQARSQFWNSKRHSKQPGSSRTFAGSRTIHDPPTTAHDPREVFEYSSYPHSTPQYYTIHTTPSGFLALSFASHSRAPPHPPLDTHRSPYTRIGVLPLLRGKDVECSKRAAPRNNCEGVRASARLSPGSSHPAPPPRSQPRRPLRTLSERRPGPACWCSARAPYGTRWSP
jgi:hypothetical protein